MTADDIRRADDLLRRANAARYDNRGAEADALIAELLALLSKRDADTSPGGAEVFRPESAR